MALYIVYCDSNRDKPQLVSSYHDEEKLYLSILCRDNIFALHLVASLTDK